MDILKKAVLLVAIVSISIFMAGCGGEEAAEETKSLGLEGIDVPAEEQGSDEQGSDEQGSDEQGSDEQGSDEQKGSAFVGVDTEALQKNIQKSLAEEKEE